MDISKLAEIRTVETPVQQIIVNGVAQHITQKIPVLVCPSCNNILNQLEGSITDIVKQLSTNDEAKLEESFYCTKCGQRLKMYRNGIIDEDVLCN